MDRIISYRPDIASNWASYNIVLSQGEGGIETDTGNIKIGDGSTAWNDLGCYIPAKLAIPYDLTSANKTHTLPAITGAPQTESVYWTGGGTYKLTLAVTDGATVGGETAGTWEGEGNGHILVESDGSNWQVREYEDYLGDVGVWHNVCKHKNGERTGQTYTYQDDYPETSIYGLLSIMLKNLGDACIISGGYTKITTGHAYTAMRAYRLSDTVIKIYMLRTSNGARGTISITSTASGGWDDNNVTGLQFSLVDCRWRT